MDAARAAFVRDEDGGGEDAAAGACCATGGDICAAHQPPIHNTRPLPHLVLMSCSGLYFGQSLFLRSWSHSDRKIHFQLAGRWSTLINRNVCPACVLPVRTRVTIKNKYVEPSYDRKLLLAACEPVIPRDKRPAWERCRKSEFERQSAANMYPNSVHPQDKLLGDKLRQEILSADLIAFYHLNSITQESFTLIKNRLQHKDLWLKCYNRSVYRVAIENSRFETLRPLVCDVPNTAIVIAKGDADLKTLLQMDKKMSGFVLMFAFLQDRLVRKDELIAYSQLGSLDEVRAQLCATLNHGLASLPAHIAQPTTMLSLLLDQYVKREQKQADEGSGQQKPASPADNA